MLAVSKEHLSIQTVKQQNVYQRNLHWSLVVNPLGSGFVYPEFAILVQASIQHIKHQGK